MRSVSKSQRQAAVLEIISQKAISTQEQLADELQRAGFAVTQTTVSRDIRELGLVKIQSDTGYRYAPPSQDQSDPPRHHMEQLFQRYVTRVDFSGHLLVVRTIPGSASLVAASIDELELEQIVGTVAGDDCIFIVLRDDRKEPLPGPPADTFQLFQAWRGGH